MSPLALPPLLRGEAVPAGRDPFTAAARAGAGGADPGLLVWSGDDAAMRAALLLAPEQPLARAVGVVFALELGLVDCLGALGPPELAVHLAWPDRMKLNGGLCGRFRAAAAPRDPAAEPDWLAVGVELPIRTAGGEPGATPERTTLAEEGLGALTAPTLIEGWARHALVWIHRFMDDGHPPLIAAWRARCDALGGPVAAPLPGRFVGLDLRGGMVLVLAGGERRVIPLTDMLEDAP